jgi:hypothetical protein
VHVFKPSAANPRALFIGPSQGAKGDRIGAAAETGALCLFTPLSEKRQVGSWDYQTDPLNV